MEKILTQISNNIATITLNNPEKMNCLDMEMLASLESTLIQIKKTKSARVIVITGEGNKAFSTGGNLTDFGKLSGFEEIREWIRFGNEVFNLLESMPVATIAAINGYTMGGGLELALSCDLRIATNNSIFSMPELNHGWVPGWGGLSKLRRLIGESKAKEMILLGERIDGKEAHRIGLLNKICDQTELDTLIKGLASKLTLIDPFLLEISKTSIRDQQRTTANNDLLFDVLATNYSRK
jgi:enoyl-CoA hydratase/carnithine racemase